MSEPELRDEGVKPWLRPVTNVQCNVAYESGEQTEVDGSSIARTNALLSRVNVLIVSVRPLSNMRVRAVSYVAVNSPRVRYHANCKAIWM